MSPTLPKVPSLPSPGRIKPPSFASNELADAELFTVEEAITKLEAGGDFYWPWKDPPLHKPKQGWDTIRAARSSPLLFSWLREVNRPYASSSVGGTSKLGPLLTKPAG